MELDNLKKQAKALTRWHRERNYSIGERIRKLPRYQNLTDAQALALKFPLSEAQEIVALETGYPTWAALKTGIAHHPNKTIPLAANSGAAKLKSALPVLFVSNVEATSIYFRDKLCFNIDFLHGNPPFYGLVSRGRARLHLRFVHKPVITPKARARENGLLSAHLEVENIKSLFAEYQAAGVTFAQRLKEEPWGASSFHALDPDGNFICFST